MKGKGMYLQPYKGRVKKNKRCSKKKTFISIKPLTNEDLIRYAKELNIPFFRGVFMRDGLPKKQESTNRQY